MTINFAGGGMRASRSGRLAPMDLQIGMKSPSVLRLFFDNYLKIAKAADGVDGAKAPSPVRRKQT